AISTSAATYRRQHSGQLVNESRAFRSLHLGKRRCQEFLADFFNQKQTMSTTLSRTGYAFGATGTPSALRVDADGHPTSEVALGTPAVLALLRSTAMGSGLSADAVGAAMVREDMPRPADGAL